MATIPEKIILDTIKNRPDFKNKTIFILDRTQKRIGILSNDVPKACPFYNDIFTERIENNLSTLEFEVPANFFPSSELLELEGYVIYTNPTNKKQQLFIVKEIEDSHKDISIRKIFCEHSATSDLLSTIVRPVNLISTTLENALGVVLNQTGYEVGEVEFSGLRDIEISEYTTSLRSTS